MLENQIIEWKRTWRDEYLEWVCGFANAQGGTLEIGRDDSGEVVGLADAVQLLEVLPNKIRTTMGIVADVNIQHDNGKEYIAIKVAAHHNAISYRGKYYYRSGSTNQELNGFALDELLLGKYGKTWDSVPVPRVNVEDFYRDAFTEFRKKAVSSKRLLQEDVEVSDAELLQALKLTENNYLLKAALLLFHQNPEQWCLGSYVKIGYFQNDADILYQDEISGPLITISDRVMDTIFTKYFKGLIRYEGIQRIDEYPMPREVLREAVLNAVVHKDYSTGNPIHIKIYDDKVVIYNDFQLPINMQPEKLLEGVSSRPHNPLIANAFFRSGQIEAWGRGIEKMKRGCVTDGLFEPVFDIMATVFSICFQIRNNNKEIAERGTYSTNDGGTNESNKVEEQSEFGDKFGDEFGDEFGDKFGDKFGDEFGNKQTYEKIMAIMRSNPSVSAKTIGEQIGITTRGVEKSIRSLKELGLIERVGSARSGYWVVKTNQ
jgi:ATP-dependent DNA helicase RecG